MRTQGRLVQGFSRQPGAMAHGAEPLRLVRVSGRNFTALGNEVDCLPVACQKAIVTMPKVLCRGGVVVGHHRQPAGHGFQGYIAKGFGKAREKEEVAGSVVCRQFLAVANADEDGIGNPNA